MVGLYTASILERHTAAPMLPLRVLARLWLWVLALSAVQRNWRRSLLDSERRNYNHYLLRHMRWFVAFRRFVDWWWNLWRGVFGRNGWVTA